MNLSSTIKQIDSLKKEADALKSVKPEFEQKFWDKYRLEFNYNSNHIEGNTLTYGHTQLLLLFDKVVGDYTLRELEEMKAHDVALRFVKEAALDPQHILTEKFIKEINQTILVRQYFKEAITEDGQPTRRLIEPGQYKKHSNSVRLENGEIFHYASPEETPAQMGDFIEWVRKEEESKELHPVQLAARVHYRFVRIHPFDDSNGRTSRLLMNYFLMRYGYAPLVIESADKKNYLTALNRADVGDIEAFVNYISDQSLRWQQLYTRAAKGKTIEEYNDVYKEIELLKHKIDYTTQPERIFSNQTLKIVYSKSLQPFLIQVFDKLSTFDNYFLRKEIHFSGLGNGIIKTVQHDFTKFVNRLSDDPNIKPFTWTFSVIHRNLSKTNNVSFIYTTNFDIYFDDTFYEVRSSQIPQIIIKKLYHQVINNDETESFGRELLKKELEAIKKEIGDL
jgi:Fic family protein